MLAPLFFYKHHQTLPGVNYPMVCYAFPDCRARDLYLMRTNHLIKEDYDVAQESGVQQFCSE